jgi:hypothetical protein
VSNRANGRGCPYCAGKKVCEDNNLEFLYPDLAKEWHPTKNGMLKPSDVTPNSGQKVWWMCVKGHKWKATVDNRARGRGCLKCYQINRK